MTQQLFYPATFTESEDEGSTGILISFRDVPEALSQASGYLEAVEMATDALLTASEFYIEDGRPMSRPSELKLGDVMIAFTPKYVTLKDATTGA